LGVRLFPTVFTVACSALALADGAIPNAQQVLLPVDRPNQILVSTTFGFLVSNDSGSTWQYVCEEVIAPLANNYQLGPAPTDPVVAASSGGVVSSRDTGCTWTIGTGGSPLQKADDVFLDPNDANHVLAIGLGSVDGGVQYGVYDSTDGGRTFAATPKFLGPLNAILTGVEISRSAPGTLYIAMFENNHPSIVRSVNGGASFSTFDLSATLNLRLGIAAVDPVTSTTLYLRANTSPDSLAISTDGGMSVRIAIQLSAAMSAFLRRADGTLLVASFDGKGFRSKDGGSTFTPWTNTLHINGLAERGTSLYAATVDAVDGFAVAVTQDEGMTWQPLLRLKDIQGPVACVSAMCAVPFASLLARLNAGNPNDAGPPVDASMARKQPAENAGCACSFSRLAGGLSAPLLLLLAIAVLLLHRRRA
jgi:hypothetical protein